MNKLGNSVFAPTGAAVNITLLTLPAFSALRAAMAQDRDPPNATSGYDAIIVTPSALGDASQVPGKLLDLQHLVWKDQLLDWTGVSAQWKQAVMQDGAISAIPLIPAPQMFYYHLEAFQKYNLTIPQTWEEFTDLAERFHGTDNLTGACVQTEKCFSESFTLRMVFSSYVQTHGAVQGLFWDAETLATTVNSPAMQAALEIVKRLRVLAPVSNGTCTRRHFAAGTCLMSINAGPEFKAGQREPGFQAMRGKTGFALPPGSTHVLDRQTNTLQPCNQERCPMASGTAVVNGVRLPVNRPITSSVVLVILNGLSPPTYQFYTYNLFSYLASPAVVGTRGLLASKDYNEILPIRAADLELSNVPIWVQNGYDPQDVVRFLTNYKEISDSENVNSDSRITLATNLTSALLAAALAYTTPNVSGPPVNIVMEQLDGALHRIVEASGGRDVFGTQYRRSINYNLGGRGRGQESTSSNNDGSDTALTLGLAIGIPLGLVFLLGLAVALLAVFKPWRRSVPKHSQLAAPGAGSSTTLCVTDIQDSTTLWETFAAEHMDVALKVHHRIIRQLVLTYSGYESATEGDSFILAFHTPLDALLFAVEAQQALLDAPWPSALVHHDPLPGLDPEDDPVGEVLLSSRPPVRTPKPPTTPRPRYNPRPSAPGSSPRLATAASGGAASAAGVAALAAANLPPFVRNNSGNFPPSVAGAGLYGGPSSGGFMSNLNPASANALGASAPVPALASADSCSAPDPFRTVALGDGQREVGGTFSSDEVRDLVGDAAAAAAAPAPVVDSASPSSARGSAAAGGIGRQGSSPAYAHLSSNLATTSRGSPSRLAGLVPSARAFERRSADSLGGVQPAEGDATPRAGAAEPVPIPARAGSNAPSSSSNVVGSAPQPSAWPQSAGALEQRSVEPLGTGPRGLLATGRSPSIDLSHGSRLSDRLARVAMTQQAHAASAAGATGSPLGSQRRALPSQGLSSAFEGMKGSLDGTGNASLLSAPSGQPTIPPELALAGTSTGGAARPGATGSTLLSAASADSGPMGFNSDGRLPEITGAATAGDSRGGGGGNARALSTIPSASAAIMAAMVYGGASTLASVMRSQYYIVPAAAAAAAAAAPASGPLPLLSLDAPSPVSQPLAAPGPNSGSAWLAVGAAGGGGQAQPQGQGSPGGGSGGGGAAPSSGAMARVPTAARGEAGNGGVLVFRGLRVRIGLHSGITSAQDVSRNATSGRMTYSGYPLRLAKAVSDAAHGGMVLFSETTREELLVDEAAAARALQHVLVLWMGRHALGEGLKDMHLFLAASRGLAGRITLAKPLRTPGGPQHPFCGVLAAPVGVGTAARLAVVGAASLLAWNYPLAMYALDLLYEMATEELESVSTGMYGAGYGSPYLVEGAFGLCSRPRSDKAAAAAAFPPSSDGPPSNGTSSGPLGLSRLSNWFLRRSEPTGPGTTSTPGLRSSLADSMGSHGPSDRGHHPQTLPGAGPQMGTGVNAIGSGTLSDATVDATVDASLTSGEAGAGTRGVSLEQTHGSSPPPSQSQLRQLAQSLRVPQQSSHHQPHMQRSATTGSVARRSGEGPGVSGSSLARRLQRAAPRATTAGGGAVAWLAAGAGGGKAAAAAAPGVMTAVFHHPAAAAAWLLRVAELIPFLDWPAELLAHPLCEEVAFEQDAIVGSLDSDPAAIRRRMQWHESSLSVTSRSLSRVAAGPSSKALLQSQGQGPAPRMSGSSAARGPRISGSGAARPPPARVSSSGAFRVTPAPPPPVRNASGGAGGAVHRAAFALQAPAPNTADCNSSRGSGAPALAMSLTATAGPGPVAEGALAPESTHNAMSRGRSGNPQVWSPGTGAAKSAAGPTAAGDSVFAQAPLDKGVVFRGLRVRGALAYGELGGEVPSGFSTGGHISYKGKAWSALAKLSGKGKGKAGEVVTNASTLSMLPPELQPLMVLRST
ncbi:hypothetical protein HYH03_002734 [Edaphochlamys debaryana]|uniref:Guanylate cyclase domain-containing protein n=1 Tax=Edaphochlamys debaryana TaxID=47281 RepID=A0A836C4W7_9CHLO|nr:hypothetical protein HYH03_002734 [Edaphochlamys debaryana]|eukprot:KAG2499152.1 hypothetical protein HYH03_002734 [Edaphochlamys debaryana]